MFTCELRRKIVSFASFSFLKEKRSGGTRNEHRGKEKEISENEEKTENQEEKKEERAFVDFIVAGEERAASPGMSYGSNGAIVPTTIAKKSLRKSKNFHQFTRKSRNLTPKARWKFRFMALILVLIALRAT